MKTIISVSVLLCFFATNVRAQDKANKKSDVYFEVEKMPVYPGGMEALKSFIMDNVAYPENAKIEGITGTVYVNFIIDKKGNVTNEKIERGVETVLDKEALRVIGLMDRWKPGENDGKVVNVSVTLPIKFELESKSSDRS